jgi:hypothetical protein
VTMFSAGLAACSDVYMVGWERPLTLQCLRPGAEQPRCHFGSRSRVRKFLWAAKHLVFLSHYGGDAYYCLKGEVSEGPANDRNRRTYEGIFEASKRPSKYGLAAILYATLSTSSLSGPPHTLRRPSLRCRRLLGSSSSLSGPQIRDPRLS